MDELDPIPTAKKPRRFSLIFVGLVIGILGTVFLPSLVRPYLPAALRGSAEQIDGTVFKKQLEDGDKARLLLSVNTEHGAVLATFTRKVAEIDMLVDEGDRVTLGVGGYEPFISDPVVAGVKKGSIPVVGGESARTDESAGLDGEPAVEESAPQSIWPSGASEDGAATESDGDPADG